MVAAGGVQEGRWRVIRRAVKMEKEDFQVGDYVSGVCPAEGVIDSRRAGDRIAQSPTEGSKKKKREWRDRRDAE